MAYWWEHSPPTNVARFRFPDSVSNVGWVCWFSSLLWEVFPFHQKPTFGLKKTIVNSDLSYVGLISSRIVNCHGKTPCGELSIRSIVLLSVSLLSILGWTCSGGVVLRALASHQCGPSSISRVGVICGLSLSVLFSALRSFSTHNDLSHIILWIVYASIPVLSICSMIGKYIRRIIIIGQLKTWLGIVLLFSFELSRVVQCETK